MWIRRSEPSPSHAPTHSQVRAGCGKKLLVYLFGRLINSVYFAPGFKMSYVAEWRGGGPHDLLRGFDSFRNCQLIVFYGNNG